MKRKSAVVVGALICGLLLIPMSGVTSAVLPSPWQLDRINQATLPLDSNVAMGPLTGAGIDIYIVDTGVRPTHEQLRSRVVAGIDVPTQTGKSRVDPPSSDCDGHGTHVAGLAAGTTVGVARGARIISVRVLDCTGDGSIDDVVTALQWVRAHHRSGVAAIANLSLGVDLGDDGTVINREVAALIADGIVVTVAAGNGGSSGGPFDACKIAPANQPDVITVGAVTSTDSKATYSNFGSCVHIFAPGGDGSLPVTSSWFNSDNSYNYNIGTSMASPLVAGYAALLAQQQPGLCPSSIRTAVLARATPDVLKGLDSLSPNKLLFLNTAPIAPTVPGQPSHVIVTTDASSLVVSWDPPCNGGEPLIKTRVSILLNGGVIRRVTVDPTKTATRITGLTNGVQYQVVVNADNALGKGKATRRISSMAVRGIRQGQIVRTSSLGTITGDLDLKWTISSSTRTICALKSSPSRLVGLRRGTCRVGLRTISGQIPVMRNIFIS